MKNYLPYIFHPIADEQQTDIWLYTYQHWGAKQADQYIERLHEKLLQIADNPFLLKKLPIEINSQIQFFHYGRHYVFVRRTETHNTQEKIQVLTLLHDSMDISQRLREVLEQALTRK